MIEDVIRCAEEAIARKDLVGALAAKKVFMYITRETDHGDIAYFTEKYREICQGIDELINMSESCSCMTHSRSNTLLLVPCDL